MMHVHVLLILCSVEVWGKTATENVRKEQKSTWEVHLVRRNVNKQITRETLDMRTPTSCSFSCSEILGVKALSLYFVNETNACFCNKVEDNSSDNVSAGEIYYGTLKTLYKVQY